MRIALLLIAVALSGCGTTVFLDKLEAPAINQQPSAPAVGTSTTGGDARIVANPQNASSSDRWLRLGRQVPTQPGGGYIGTFTENVTNTKASVALVGFIPKSSPIMMTVFFEPKPPAPPAALLHIDLLPDGRIRINDTTFAGTYKFDTLIGFSVGFNLAGSAPSASVVVRGGGDDAGIDVPISPNIAQFGLGRVRVFAPFEGVNAPAGAFFVNEIFASR